MYESEQTEPDNCRHSFGQHAAAVVRSPNMVRLYELVTRVARTSLPALVQGETGTGKELVARAVHERSARAGAIFRALNCATLPPHLLESVLFGHERGAFTGAERTAAGVFEQAEGGTLFLDEVGELAPHAQAALLRVLEQRCVTRVGGTKEIPVNVRVVAATHRDVATMVRTGAFREDLMFRLETVTLRVPPLRERTEEIMPLAELFLEQARAGGAAALRLSECARRALLVHPWPGNVRQLKNVIDRAAVVCTGDEVQLIDLPPPLGTGGDGHWALPLLQPAAAAAPSLPERVREFEIGIIRQAMRSSEGNQARAARLLGVPRRTLANKVHAYRLLA